jgi:hypothetical protein
MAIAMAQGRFAPKHAERQGHMYFENASSMPIATSMSGGLHFQLCIKGHHGMAAPREALRNLAT